MRPNRISGGMGSPLPTAALLSAPGGAWGQMPAFLPDAPESRTFGTASEIAHVVGADEFASNSSFDVWDHSVHIDSSTGFLFRGSTDSVTWFAPVRLPA